MNFGTDRAVESLIAELNKGIAITRRLDHHEFAFGRGGGSSIGAHIRHNLDFVDALLNGIAERRVDYNARARDARVETDREHAAAKLSFACSRLKTLTPALVATLIMVRSEIDEDVWHASSVSREIEFLHSHTVHHHALIAKLATSVSFHDSFGVSPSTLRSRSCAENQSVYAG
jgi:hypothetical protein